MTNISRNQTKISSTDINFETIVFYLEVRRTDANNESIAFYILLWLIQLNLSFYINLGPSKLIIKINRKSRCKCI